jgi:hypothetical protein
MMSPARTFALCHRVEAGDGWWRGSVGVLGWPLFEGPVRAVAVVVLDVLVKHPTKVLLVHDQEAIETLTAQCADPTLSERVRSRPPHRAPDHPHAYGREHRVQGDGELRVAVTDHELEGVGAFTEIGGEVTCALAGPQSGRMAGDAQ